MNPQLARPLATLLLLAGWVSPLPAQKWQVQYFYDKAKTTFQIADLQFPSPTRGIAVGVITNEKEHQEPTSVVTSDGGAHWQTVAIKEPPVSLFFLNENTGWMVTTKGLWQTSEAGRTWTKLPKIPNTIIRVHFLDEQHGFAIGSKKTALETHDAGITWQPLDLSATASGENINYTAYTWIDFATPKVGLITGWNNPPNRYGPDLPDWVDPAVTLHQRVPPHITYTVATYVGAQTWKASAGSLFGVVTRVRLHADGTGLGLIDYGQSFRYPSEVYSIKWPPGTTHTVYRDSKFAVTDIWQASDGTAYLAGIVIKGQLRSLIPTPVQVLTSKDLKDWKPIPVDYRAEATTAILAAAGDDNLWMATNTGMILKLVR